MCNTHYVLYDACMYILCVDGYHHTRQQNHYHLLIHARPLKPIAHSFCCQVSVNLVVRVIVVGYNCLRRQTRRNWIISSNWLRFDKKIQNHSWHEINLFIFGQNHLFLSRTSSHDFDFCSTSFHWLLKMSSSCLIKREDQDSRGS